MQAKVYFYLLILCGICSQGIIRTLANEIKNSSDFHIREKRVVSYVPGEDKATRINKAPYVVNIRYNGRIICVGSILSQHVVITIPLCVNFAATLYKIVSGSSRSDHGNTHNVTDIKKHYGSHASRSTDGIALLTVVPFFIFGTYTNFIELHSRPLLQNTVGLISGWGYNSGPVANHGTKLPISLRTIEVQIMAHRDCVNRYRPYNMEITDEDVCTYHPEKHCGHNDGGAALVVDGYLAGVYLWTGPGRVQNCREFPDVFVILQHSQFNQWIRTNIQNIEAQFQNHHN